MVAPACAETRSKLDRKMGLGQARAVDRNMRDPEDGAVGSQRAATTSLEAL